MLWPPGFVASQITKVVIFEPVLHSIWVSADSMTNNERLIGTLTWRDEGVVDGGFW
jgi:hypothetical protein